MLSLQILSFGGLLKCGLISEWREDRRRRKREETEQGSRIIIQKYHNIFTQQCNESSGHDTVAYTVDYIRLD